jgi:hypothetical protein
MNLQASSPIAVAPRFHLPFRVSERIQLSAGVEEHEGRYYPRLPWRNPTADELALLAGESAKQAAHDALLLFRLPEHLIARWWKLVESARGPLPDGLGEFDAFVNAVRDFLAFKNLAIPSGACCDLVITQPGHRAIGWDAPASYAPGLRSSADAGTATSAPRLWGGINLGGECGSVVFSSATPSTGEPADFDQPLVRLLLEPGEGIRFPEADLLMGLCTLEQEDPGLMLMLHTNSPDAFPAGALPLSSQRVEG